MTPVTSQIALNPVVDRAIQPDQAGRLVRTLGAVLPGVGRTRDQIAGYRDLWIENARFALGSDDPVLVVLGDSLGQGVGARDINNSYPFRVETELRSRSQERFNILNLSQSGARVGDVLDVQLPALQASGAKIMTGLCTVGSNDLSRSGRFGTTRNRLSRLLAELPNEIIVATLPDRGSMAAKSINRHLRSEADRLGRPLADVASLLTSWRGKIAGDGFHPNDVGYELWARAFMAVIDECEAPL